MSNLRCIKCGKQAKERTPAGYYIAPEAWICSACGIPIGVSVADSNDTVLKKFSTSSPKCSKVWDTTIERRRKDGNNNEQNREDEEAGAS